MTSREIVPRRKSCHACHKAKRRCDLSVPACGRCAEMGIACEYAALNRAAKQLFPSDGIDIANDTSLDALIQDGLFDTMLGQDDIVPSSAATAALIDSPASVQPLPTFNNDLGSRPTIPTELPFTIQQRLDYVLSRFDEAVRSVPESMSAPWMHRYLYRERTPLSMQHASGICALYLHKNAANAQHAFRCIEGRVRELIAEQQQLDQTMPLLDVLAHTHAFQLYQFIQLFDGSVRQRAIADSLRAEFEASIALLKAVLEREELAHHTDDEVRSVDTMKWRSWIERESARRTIMASYILLTIYRVATGDRACHSNQANGKHQCWTLSAGLWNAESLRAFERAGRNDGANACLMLQGADVQPAFALLGDRLKPEHVDAFGKMFMVVSQGVEEIRCWYGDAW